MLDTDTKRRIDEARDILVGKIPDPKSQVEQITIALIYKFMNDIDAESEALGGRRTFFAGEFAKYRWANLIHSGLGGHETLNLYAEALTRIPENPSIPPLFRDIFNNVYLPYRDPETLRMFLNVIDDFTYDHSERLGDAFEHLLSVMGSQGDAGQFRTPRHIIDFMVKIIDPQKHERVLDPACGTAGFLISSYKHIRDASPQAEDANAERPALTPDEHARLVRNLTGYDISPDMVRLSLVNMYLHGFPQPSIHEYDALTSEERWDEYADVILANPPFMSPKGGIRPHSRFSVQSRRSEVLFVDYIAEHLTPGGRAAVIVPEGVIFQSQNAHKSLRKMLVEDYLVAVVSLPAGVFQPYSGVKTSILILDRAAARRVKHVAFFKVENDGYDLGAQRRPIAHNDLPAVETELAACLRRLQSNEPLQDLHSTHGFLVDKERIAEDGEYNLSGERYRDDKLSASEWPMAEIGDMFHSRRETVIPKTLNGPITYVGLENITQNTGQLTGQVLVEAPSEIKSAKNVFRAGDILYGRLRPNLNKVWIADRQGICSTDIIVMRSAKDNALPALYAHILRGAAVNAAVIQRVSGAQLPRISWRQFKQLRIPLPPLEVQREIVAEIEGYQRVIDGARAVVENYQPHVDVDPSWRTAKIGDVCQLVNGRAFKPSDWETADSGGLPIVRIQNLNAPDRGFNYYTGKVKEQFIIERGQLLFSWSGSRGTSFGAHIWQGSRAILNQHIFKVGYDPTQVNKNYLFLVLNRAVVEVENNLHGGVGLVHITKGNLEKIHIPVPDIEIQESIVAEIEAERAIVDANRELVERMEGRIAAAIARVWNG